MAKKILFINDLADTREDDKGQSIVDCPVALENTTLTDIRYKASTDTAVNGNDESDFFIDDSGVKHLQNYSADHVEVTRNITLDRRGGPDDVIKATTGDFTTEFTVGKIINLEGSANSDGIPMKLKTVAALEMTIDEDFNRIVIDEATAFSCKITQGWQRLEGINFSDTMGKDSVGRWYAKSDNELRNDTYNIFKAQLKAVVEGHRISKTSVPERHSSPPESSFAMKKIVRNATSFSPKDCFIDAVRYGGWIYDEDSETLSGVDITFDTTLGRITRASGDFTSENWHKGMQVTVAGSTNNDEITVAIDGIVALSLEVSSADTSKLTQEGPVSGVTLTGLNTVTGYVKFRSNDDPGEVHVDFWRRYMEECVAENWFDNVAELHRNYRKKAKDANNWAATTSYSVGDVVFDPISKFFIECNTAHTSQSTLSADSEKWDNYLPTGIVLPDYPTTQIDS